MRNWTENPVSIHLTLIRHGATASNAEGRYLGKTEESLCPEGIQKLRKAVAEGYYPEAELVFCSPMKRCLETAGILYPGLTPVRIPEWTEMDFGAFEGHNYRELSGDPGYQQWIDSGGTLPFPEGESREDFIRRCVTGYTGMLAALQRRSAPAGTGGQPLHVSAVVHGGTIMALLSHFTDRGYFEYQVKCGQGYCGRLEFPAGEEDPEWKDFRPLQDPAKGEIG